MPYLSPPTVTQAEQKAILQTTVGHPRDHLIFSPALGTGVRLAEVVGLNVGGVYLPDGTPRTRVRLRPEIAKGGRAGDVFVPDALAGKLRRFLAYKVGRRESLEPTAPPRVKTQTNTDLPCTTAGFTSLSLGHAGFAILDSLASVHGASGSCPSARRFVPRFLRTVGRPSAPRASPLSL